MDNISNEDIKQLSELNDGWFGRISTNGRILGSKFDENNLIIADNVLSMLRNRTEFKWNCYHDADNDISIDTDDYPEVCFDLLFSVKIIMIRNNKGTKKDKIIMPKIIDDCFYDYIKIFLNNKE